MSISLNGDGIVSGVTTFTTPLTGVTTFSSVDATSVVVGSAVTINSSGINIGVSTFYGDASGLTNVPAGSSVTGDFTITSGNLVLSSGNGIDFSAASNAAGMTSELLDDYEEGTFTPELNFGGSTTGITYLTEKKGTYTKIGNVVRFVIDFQLSNKGTATGNATIAGLPFTISNTNGTSVATGMNTITVDAKGDLLLQLASGTTGLLRGTASNSNYTDTAFGNNTIVRFTGTYQVS